MKHLAIIVSLVALLMSCSKESEKTISNGKFDIHLDATLPELKIVDNAVSVANGTKASTQYTVRIKWAAGDKLSVINFTTGKILGGNIKANSSGTLTTFTGSVTGTVNNGDVLAFFYPEQNNTGEVDYSPIHIDMANQAGTTGGVPLCVFSTMTANGDSFSNLSLTFSYLMCYMMIGLSDIPAGSTIKSVTLTNLTSNFDLSINSGKSGFDITTHPGNIVLTPNQTASAAGVKTVYAAIPGSAATTREAILETNTTTFTTAFSSAKLNNGYAYNTNVAGFLADNLVMADPKMQEYCLQHFDANGDGKLSMVEIAGVTEFPDQTQYPIPSDITSFDELEYFYSLTSLPSFKNQNKLQSITIPKQITSIPDEMFYGCSTLVKVTLKPTTPPSLGNNVFTGIAGSLILFVDDECVADYQAADGWINYADCFRTPSGEYDSDIDFDVEDDDNMGDDRIEIIIE
ncbi:MAG: leucine-rich repeat protein [Bacteroidales bacterium]|nr:leucine-rich repeat protein [Bacteroidales bacterium]